MDALKVLRYSASLSYGQNEPCTNMGAVLPNGETQGDVDCSNTIGAIDSLKILRFSASLAYSQAEPCPNIGS
jgi:hypothetical protein